MRPTKPPIPVMLTSVANQLNELPYLPTCTRSIGASRRFTRRFTPIHPTQKTVATDARGLAPPTGRLR